MNSFIYASNGEAISAPRYLRSAYKKIQRLQRKLSHREKKTAKYLQVLNALRKAYYRLKCKRLSFFYEQAHSLLQKNDVVIVEDLDIQNMVKRPVPKLEEATGHYLPNGASRKAGLNTSIYVAVVRIAITMLRKID